MFESIVALLNFVFNTPLFYLILVFVVIGYMAWRTRRDMQALGLRGKKRIALRGRSSPIVMQSDGVCERCGRLTNKLTEAEYAGGDVVWLCSSCQTILRKMRAEPLDREGMMKAQKRNRFGRPQARARRFDVHF